MTNPIVFAEHLCFLPRGDCRRLVRNPVRQADIKREGDDEQSSRFTDGTHVAWQAAEILEEKVRTGGNYRSPDSAAWDKRNGVAVGSQDEPDRHIEETGGRAVSAANCQHYSGRLLTILDGPVARVGGIDVPAPYNGTLEAATIPSAERVIKALEDNYGI